MSNFFVSVPAVGAGDIVSINGDSTPAQLIVAGSGLSVATSSGVTTITNTAATTESFTIWQTDHGTSPTAVSPTDIMDLTSSDASVTITGNAGTNTINFQVANTFTPGNLTSGTTGVAVSGGTSAVNGGGATISVQTASVSQPGLLSAADWATFNGKQASGNYVTALTADVVASGPGSAAATIQANAVSNSKLAQMTAHTVKANTGSSTADASDVALGTVSESTSSVLTLAGWSNATIGSPTIQVTQADASHAGYLASADWSTFNNKQATLSFSSPLSLSGATVTLPTINFTNTTVSNWQNGPDILDGYYNYEEWDTSATTGRLQWTRTLVGTGTSSLASDTNRPGINKITISANADSAVFNLSAATISLGGGVFTYQTAVMFPTLSDGSNTYIFKIGLGSQGSSSTDGANLIYFQYDQGTDGNFWDICTRAGSGTKQKTVSSLTVAANTWYTLQFVVNAGASSVQFFGATSGSALASLGTISSQVPTGTSQNLAACIVLLKTLGSGSVNAQTDYSFWKQTFTTAR